MLSINVKDIGVAIVNSAEIMKVRPGIYRIILNSYTSKIRLSSYFLSGEGSLKFSAGAHDFEVEITGIPIGDYLALSDEMNNTYYLIDERKFNDNNPRKAVWTNGD